MDVTEDNWTSIARDNIDKYLHRGGNGKGNESQFLGGTNLQNTIGIALGLPLTDPKTWSAYELQQAENAQLCFFDGSALQAINIIVESIKYCCGGDTSNYITVIPIELYFNRKLYEIPVFRVQRYENSKVYYVDNIGRYYYSFEDWNNHNKLPPCKIIYPQRLELKSDGIHAIVSPPYDTPSASTGNQVVQGFDIAAGVVGIASAIGLMILSGPFAPILAVAGGASAVWGTGRAIYELVDRGDHGQSIDPFKDDTARSLWLGVAASIAGFGAMGVTMRVSANVARGIQLSRALTIFTDSVNGISLTLNAAAIINNTIYLIQQINEMTAAEILLNIALLAFWTKGTFTYRRASVIIKQAQDQAFTRISKELSPEVRAAIYEVRNKVNNDANLLHLFDIAGKSNISTREFSHLLIDGMNYYENIAKLSTEQLEAFISLRNYLQDDLRLLSGLQRFSQASNLNTQDTLELVLTLWQKYTSTSTSRGDIRLTNGSLVMGNAPPIKITTLPQLSSPLIKFVGEHLTKIEANTVDHWSIPELISFQDRGLFTVCPVTGISKTGISTLVLNGEIQLSLKKLQTIPIDKCKTMLKMISEVNPGTSSKLPTDLMKLCVRELRLRFEVQRNESMEWARGAVSQSNLKEILRGDLLPHEKDRLYTFKTEVNMKKAELYMNDMMNFVSEMNPKNVSEMVAYSEFAMTYVDEIAANIEQSIRNGTRKLPHNTKKTVWLRQQAKEEAFGDLTAVKQKLNDFMKIADENDMIGIQTIQKGLSDDKLVAEIRSQRVRFGGRASAAYHIYKHSTDPVTAYVDQANNTIRSPSSKYNVSIGQEGDTRIISFTDVNGSGIVLEKDGRILLATFRANDRK